MFQVPGAGLRLKGEPPALPPVEVRLVRDQNLVTEGTIREISPGVDPVTRTYTVKVALIDPPPAFLLGSSVVGRAKLPAQSVINLPSSALFQTAAGRTGGLGRRSAAGYGQPAAGVRPSIRYRNGYRLKRAQCRRNGRDRRQPEAQAGTEGNDQAGERSMTCGQIPKPGARLLPAVLLAMALALHGCEEKSVPRPKRPR